MSVVIVGKDFVIWVFLCGIKEFIGMGRCRGF